MRRHRCDEGVLSDLVSASASAAIMKSKKGPAKGELFTDEDWNDEATLTEGSYPYSKVKYALRMQLRFWDPCHVTAAGLCSLQYMSQQHAGQGARRRCGRCAHACGNKAVADCGALPQTGAQTEAEKAARKLCEEEKMDIVTIHPSFVLGPVISSRTDATSVSTFKVRHWASPGASAYLKWNLEQCLSRYCPPLSGMFTPGVRACMSRALICAKYCFSMLPLHGS